MKEIVQNRHGSLLLEALFVGLICLVAVYGLHVSMRASSNAESLTLEKVQSEQFASELLEYFRSLSSAQLKDYLNNSPGPTVYDLCSHINIIDPSQKSSCALTILQPDTRAELPISELGNPGSCTVVPCAGNPQTNCYVNSGPNRFYQVQIVDLENNLAARCGTTATALGPNERYLVTVGVSWLNSDNSVRQQVQLSTILARNN